MKGDNPSQKNNKTFHNAAVSSSREGSQEKECDDEDLTFPPAPPELVAIGKLAKRFWHSTNTLDFQNRALGIGTLAIAVFTGLTFYVIFTGSGDTKKAAEAAASFSTTAEQIRGDLQQAVVDNKQALADNNESIKMALAENRRELAELLGQNRQSLLSGISQSKAALGASIDASHIDERPWLLPDGFSLSMEPNIGEKFFTHVGFRNSGKTPAVKVTTVTHNWFSNGEPPQNYGGLQPSSFSVAAPSVQGYGSETEPFLASQQQIAAYRAHATRLYIVARFEYEDTFTPPKKHWTTICVWHEFGMPLQQFNFCQSGNGVG